MSLDKLKKRVLADNWYSAILGSSCAAFDTELDRRFGYWTKRLIRRFFWLHGLTLWFIGRKYEAIVVTYKQRSWDSLLFYQSLLGPKHKLIDLEFIHEKPRSECWFNFANRHAFRRAVRTAQVMTQRERSEYVSLYGVEESRLKHIPWFMRYAADKFNNAKYTGNHTAPLSVLATGRSYCDWETLFLAAAGRNWPLTVICGRNDFERCQKLNQNNTAALLCEVSEMQHQEYVNNATIYVIPLAEKGVSAGHCRLTAAVRASVPVVATRIKALDGYVADGETALLFDPKDHEALGKAVDRLLADPVERLKLAKTAFDRASGNTYENYCGQIRQLVFTVTAP